MPELNFQIEKPTIQNPILVRLVVTLTLASMVLTVAKQTGEIWPKLPPNMTGPPETGKGTSPAASPPTAPLPQKAKPQTKEAGGQDGNETNLVADAHALWKQGTARVLPLHREPYPQSNQVGRIAPPYDTPLIGTGKSELVPDEQTGKLVRWFEVRWNGGFAWVCGYYVKRA